MNRQTGTHAKLSLHHVLPFGLRWAARPLDRAVGFSAAAALVKTVDHLEGADFIAGLLRAGAARLVVDGDPACVPREGPLVVVSNHPFGLVDGLAVLSVLLPRRPDLKVVLTHAWDVGGPLRDVVISVR